MVANTKISAETGSKKSRITAQTAQTGAARRFKGVRMRSWGKWVSEIRLPNTRARLWLGSFSTAEEAARAFDVAVTCLRGRSAVINFPDSPPEYAPMGLPYPHIQRLAASAAAKYAEGADTRSHEYPDESYNSYSSPSPSISTSSTTTTSSSQEDLDDLASCEATHHHQHLNEALLQNDDFSPFFKHLFIEDELPATMVSPLLPSNSMFDFGCPNNNDTFFFGEDHPHFVFCHPISSL